VVAKKVAGKKAPAKKIVKAKKEVAVKPDTNVATPEAGATL